MANKLSTAIQNTQQALMQRELQYMKHKLEQTSKTIAQKDLLIGSLEIDLEHMIEQLVRIKRSSGNPNATKQWITRAVPGVNQEVIEQATA